MKKFFILLILLLTPSLIAAVLLYKFFPQDSQQLIDYGKVKIVEKFPTLKKYISLPVKKPEKIVAKEKVQENLDTPLVVNLQHFTNAEVYAPICGEEVKEKFNTLFMQCNVCPKYLNYTAKEQKFTYFYESRGKILNINDEEAFVIMKGCQDNPSLATVILLRKGYGGWLRVKHYSGIQIDKKPLEFFASNGMLIYVSKKVIVSEKELKQEIYSFQLQKDKIEQKDLFAIVMERSLDCRKSLQGSIDDPAKLNSTTFQSNLEIIGCDKENKLNGFHKVTFKLNDDNVFYPNKDTASLMTKIEKYGENDVP